MSDAAIANTLDRLRLNLTARYAVTREIGRGGMAAVYLADDLRHGRQVAVKVLKPEIATSVGADRFLREIRLAAQLQHPHILPLYDSGEADGLLFYVMPFVEGESLREKLNREQQLDIGEAVRLVVEVADALGYAHSHGVVHRDIKPENIMISAGHALVADFGIAKAVSAGAERLTQTGMAIGTPHYMSPEQTIGEHVDARTDQYSLGCVLYELLAGTPPFTGPTPMAVLARHSLERVPSLRIVRQAIPEGVEVVVQRALAKVPADRFHTMAEFATALRDAELERISIRTGARPVPTGELPVLRLRRRRTVPVLLGATTLILAVAGGGYLAWSTAGSNRSDPGGRGPDPRRLAVLYFESRGGSDSLGYLADGFTEALIQELSRVRALQVISRNGVAPYRGAAVPPDSIARALKAGTLVTGSVAQLGDRLRLNVALVSGATGTELGSKTLEQPRREIFALQDELAKEVALFLRQRLGEAVELRQSRAGTRSARAWELLQQAQRESKTADELIGTGDTSAVKRHFALADSLLAQAEAADPEWAMPATLRGWLAYRQTRLAGSFEKDYYAEWIGRGLGHSERALALRPADPDALELRGTLRYWRLLLNLEPSTGGAARLLDAAEADLRASGAANPDQASAWTSLSHLLMRRGHTAEGKAAALRAYEADPYLTNANLTLWRLASSSVDLEDASEARRWCVEGQRRFPDDPRFAECQLLLFSLKGQKPDVAKAWALVRQFVQLSPPNLREYRRRQGEMLVALALARAGLGDSARSVARRARADAASDPTRDLALWEAYLHTMLRDRDEAFRLLTTYLATNPQDRASFAGDPSWWLRDLRDDPRWQSLIAAR